MEYRGLEIKIMLDSDPMDPRADFDPFGKMVCFLSRYNLGDDHSYADEDEFWADINSTGNETLVLSVYLFDHSGLTISTEPFASQWDSMKIGWIYAEVGKEGITDVDEIRERLKNEVEIYNQYLTGDVWGYEIEETDDSCWGFYGDDHENNGLLYHARAAIDCYLQHKSKQDHLERLEHAKELKGSFAFRRRKHAVRTV